MQVIGLEKPLPLQDDYAEPYWQAARSHRLVLLRCAACENYVHPPAPRCPTCGGGRTLAWEDIGTDVRGEVYSYVIVERAVLRSFMADVPYVAALCDLDRIPGIHIAANVFGCSVEDVHVGTRVRMVWEDRTPEVSLPQWVLDIAAATGSGASERVSQIG